MLHYRKAVTVLVFLILWLSILASCQRNAPPELPPISEVVNADTGLVTGKPCSPPCWQGIVPGEATREDVMFVLENSTIVSHEDDSIASTTDIRGIEIIWWRETNTKPPSRDGPILIQDGRVTFIKLELKYHMTLRELLDLKGDPDGYYVFVALPPHRRKPYYIDINFVWLDGGLMARVTLKQRDPIFEGEELSLPEDTPISDVGYFAPTTRPLDYLQAAGISTSSQDSFQEWQGVDALVMPYTP